MGLTDKQIEAKLQQRRAKTKKRQACEACIAGPTHEFEERDCQHCYWFGK